MTADPTQSMGGYFASGTFEELLIALECAACWMHSLGIDVRAGRVGRYVDELQQLVAALKRKEVAAITSRMQAINTALYEANEIVQIHRGLGSGDYDDVLRERLRRASSGPTSYADENLSSGNLPRNVAFELVMAERLSSGGLQPLFSYDDVAVDTGSRMLLVECKRMQSATQRALRRNLRDAERQLLRCYRSNADTRLRGVVAIDLTKSTNPDFVSPYLTQSQIADQLSRYLSTFIDSNADLWHQCGKKTIAVLARVSLLIACTDPRMMTYCQQYILHPITNRCRLKPNTFDRNAMLTLDEAFQRAMARDSLPLTA
jgi:hypothetical protein